MKKGFLISGGFLAGVVAAAINEHFKKKRKKEIDDNKKLTEQILKDSDELIAVLAAMKQEKCAEEALKNLDDVDKEAKESIEKHREYLKQIR